MLLILFQGRTKVYAALEKGEAVAWLAAQLRHTCYVLPHFEM